MLLNYVQDRKINFSQKWGNWDWGDTGGGGKVLGI